MLEAKGASALGERPTSVLVVEDDERCAIALGVALRGSGIPDVRIVGTVSEALQRLDPMPALILCDWFVPGGDAIGLLRVLRVVKRYPVFVVYSGACEASVASRLYKEGAHAYLPKPLKLDDLWTAWTDAHHRDHPYDAVRYQAARTSLGLREHKATVARMLTETVAARNGGSRRKTADDLRMTRRGVQLQMKRAAGGTKDLDESVSPRRRSR